MFHSPRKADSRKEALLGIKELKDYIPT